MNCLIPVFQAKSASAAGKEGRVLPTKARSIIERFCGAQMSHAFSTSFQRE